MFAFQWIILTTPQVCYCFSHLKITQDPADPHPQLLHHLFTPHLKKTFWKISLTVQFMFHFLLIPFWSGFSHQHTLGTTHVKVAVTSVLLKAKVSSQFSPWWTLILIWLNWVPPSPWSIFCTWLPGLAFSSQSLAGFSSCPWSCHVEDLRLSPSAFPLSIPSPSMTPSFLVALNTTHIL